VQGRVTWAHENMDDLVLLRSDGNPTYMLAVVVDDYDMGITHIIRGDDHLTNAARQIQIYQALGWEIPVMAHIPLIHGADGAKLSKRHGALGVDAYRALGYLPEALRNYLVRLGWSHGDQEIFSTEEMIAQFNLESIGRSAARFDTPKLDYLNGHYLRTMPDADVLAVIEHVLPVIGAQFGITESFSDLVRARFLRAMPSLKERAKTLIDLMENAYFVYAALPLQFDEKAAQSVQGEAQHILQKAHTELSALTEWTHESLEACIRALATEAGVKLGLIAQPLRAALTGRSTSPSLFEVMMILGQVETLQRIQSQLSKTHEDMPLAVKQA
jgi:glutamyl-tRNA synthetase